jgi:hypothetical protein
VVQFDCHPEQASFALRRIWAYRFAPVRERYASKFKLHHYQTSIQWRRRHPHEACAGKLSVAIEVPLEQRESRMRAGWATVA